MKFAVLATLFATAQACDYKVQPGQCVNGKTGGESTSFAPSPRHGCQDYTMKKGVGKCKNYHVSAKQCKVDCSDDPSCKGFTTFTGRINGGFQGMADMCILFRDRSGVKGEWIKKPDAAKKVQMKLTCNVKTKCAAPKALQNLEEENQNQYVLLML